MKYGMLKSTKYNEVTKDGLSAIMVFLYNIIIAFVFGLFIYKSNLYNLFITLFSNKVISKYILKVIIAIFQILPIIIILYLNNDNIKSIGISSKKITKQVIVGVLFSMPIVLLNISNLKYGLGYSLININKIIFTMLDQIIFTALIEEIIFRSYIQTKLNKIIKNKILSIAIGGLMFGVAHIPFMILLYQGTIISFLILSFKSIIPKIVMHVYLYSIYTRYNNIIAPTIIHAINNTIGILFSFL